MRPKSYTPFGRVITVDNISVASAETHRRRAVTGQRGKKNGRHGQKVIEMPAAPEPENLSLDDPSLYFNRELSLLEFQRRVLDEARDERNKLLERVKFLSIVSSNLDEFFMVRNAALKQKLRAGNQDLSIDGKTVTQQLAAVHTGVAALMKEVYDCFQKLLIPDLARAGIRIVTWDSLDERERSALTAYYDETVFPVLTPLAVDPG